MLELTESGCGVFGKAKTWSKRFIDLRSFSSLHLLKTPASIALQAPRPDCNGFAMHSMCSPPSPRIPNAHPAHIHADSLLHLIKTKQRRPSIILGDIQSETRRHTVILSLQTLPPCRPQQCRTQTNLYAKEPYSPRRISSVCHIGQRRDTFTMDRSQNRDPEPEKTVERCAQIDEERREKRLG